MRTAGGTVYVIAADDKRVRDWLIADTLDLAALALDRQQLAAEGLGGPRHGHAVLLIVIAYFLLTPPASNYFRSSATP